MGTEDCKSVTQNTQNPEPEPTRPPSRGDFEGFEDGFCVSKNLVRDLLAAGVRLSIEGASIAFDAPAGVVTDERLSRMRAHRDDLLALVERFEERAAIIEHDGGVAAVEAERRAWAEVLGDHGDRPATAVVNLRRDPFDVRIDRRSKWGNPFVIGPHGDRAQVIEKYRRWIVDQPELMASLGELRGKRLGCHCAPQPCHGDVLAELADSITDGPSTDDRERQSTIVCPWCRSVELADSSEGLRCRSCGRLAWVELAEGGLCRADWADVEAIPFDGVPACDSCGRYSDTESVTGVWLCSRCDAQADHRRAMTGRWLDASEKKRSRRRSL